jgi:hypothetical protein
MTALTRNYELQQQLQQFIVSPFVWPNNSKCVIFYLKYAFWTLLTEKAATLAPPLIPYPIGVLVNELQTQHNRPNVITE